MFFDKIPVKQITEEEELPFKDKITQILTAKKNDPKADTSVFEKEIDQMVYELYGLTEEEIEIIEKS